MADVNELYTSLTQLADGFRERFNLNKNLTISEMTKLNSPNLLASFSGLSRN